MNSLTKNSIFNAVYQVLNMIFPLISSMYVAHILMPSGAGRVAYAQNIASYFVTAAALGIPIVGLRSMSVTRDDREKRNRIFSELMVLNAASTCVASILYLLLIVFNPEFRSELQLYLTVGIVIVFNFINIDWLYQGCEEYAYIVGRNILVKVLSLVALFTLVKKIDDYIIYAAITSLATCGNYVFNILGAHRHVTLQFRGLNIKQHMRPILYFSGSLFLSAIYGKVDTTMLGELIGEESVGFYSYAHKLIQVGIGFCSAVTAAFLPRLSYCFEKDKEQFYALVEKGVQLVAFLSIPAATGLFLLAPDAIELLFGTAFLPAAKTLRIFSGLIVVYSFGNLMCYQMMICTGSEKMHTIVLAAAAVINVLLNIILIPKMQHNGAAVASVCTELSINVFEACYFARILKLKYSRRAIGQAVISSGVMGICILITKYLVNGTLLSFICCVIIGIIGYFTVNLLLRNQFLMDIRSVLKKRFL